MCDFHLCPVSAGVALTTGAHAHLPHCQSSERQAELAMFEYWE